METVDTFTRIRVVDTSLKRQVERKYLNLPGKRYREEKLTLHKYIIVSQQTILGDGLKETNILDKKSHVAYHFT